MPAGIICRTCQQILYNGPVGRYRYGVPPTGLFFFNHQPERTQLMLRTTRQSWRHWWRLSRIAKYGSIGPHGTMGTHAINAYTAREWKPWFRQLHGPAGVLP